MADRTVEGVKCAIALYGKSLFERGYCVGTAGNISVRLGNGDIIITPTNSTLGNLHGDEVSQVSPEGKLLAGSPPSKEMPFHLAVYRARSDAGAVVHLHSTFIVCLSCLPADNEQDLLPPITPYSIMKFGRVRRVPYFAPGDPAIVPIVETAARESNAVLIANHGSIVFAGDLQSAGAAAEELEETAKLAFLMRGMPYNILTDQQIDMLITKYARTA